LTGRIWPKKPIFPHIEKKVDNNKFLVDIIKAQVNIIKFELHYMGVVDVTLLEKQRGKKWQGE